MRFICLAGWLWICIGIASCDRTHHSRVSKEDITDCIGKPLTQNQENKVRDKIDADKKSEKIQEIFDRKRRGGFNGSVLVAQNGVVIFEKNYGYATLKKKDSLTNQNTFQLASLSKPFTAVATLQLEEDKKLSLDDSVQVYFPNFPYKGISIRSLLSHRSGLPNYMYSFMDSVRHGKKYPSNMEVMHWFEKIKPTPYNRPERGFTYNNSNYLVLAAIVEKVSKMSFEDYLKVNILEPLGMDNTYLCTSKDENFLHYKTAGHQAGKSIPKDYYDDIVGDKGIYSNTTDLYRFYKGLSNGCLLKKKTIEEAFTPRSFERKGMKNYGYGFRMHLNEFNEAKYIYHGGWWKGYNTMLWMSPEDQFVIIVLGNSYNRSVYQLKDVIDILHGEIQNDDIDKDVQ